jgi:hypothetical protein
LCLKIKKKKKNKTHKEAHLKIMGLFALISPRKTEKTVDLSNLKEPDYEVVDFLILVEPK